jgi:hypothetical protein
MTVTQNKIKQFFFCFFCVSTKQWLLAGEFSEFEYSRETRRHSPSRVARTRQTRQTRRHSPSRVARTRQTCRHSPSRVARTRQTRERRVWHVLRKFSESGESGKFGECRQDRFMYIKYVIFA